MNEQEYYRLTVSFYMGKMLGTCPPHVWQEIEDKCKALGCDIWKQVEEDAGFTTESAKEFFDMVKSMTKPKRAELIRQMKKGKVSVMWIDELKKAIAQL